MKHEGCLCSIALGVGIVTKAKQHVVICNKLNFQPESSKNEQNPTCAESSCTVNFLKQGIKINCRFNLLN